MYARVLRKWSLKTNLMSYLWLAVVTMLLLIICAPTTTTMALAATTRIPTSTIAIKSTPLETTETKQLQLAASRRSSWQELLAKSAAATAAAASMSAIIPATNVGVVEESFYIPVAISQEEGNSQTAAWQHQQQQQHNIVHSRLINFSPSSSSSSSSSSSTSSRSSNSKILSNSKLFSNSFYKQPQRLQQPEQHADDSLVYSYYYKQHSSAPQMATAADNIADDLDDMEHDVDADADANVDVEEAEDAADLEETEEHVADASIAAASLHNIFKIDTNKQVPNVPNSQIINLYNKFTQTQPTSQQQQQLTAANVHNTKARRHVLQESYHEQQQQLQQQQLLQQVSSYHSPVRETATKAAKPVAAVMPSPAKNVSKSFTPPFRYIIEAFEIPATLPYTTLTQQQQRMLLHQQQLAARSRRDSRPFGMNAGSVGYQQHYYNSQQQQQPYQRLQQQQHHNQQNINSNNYQKSHQNTNNYNNNNHQHLQQQNYHQHHQNQLHHNHYQQHQRNKRRRYCSARDPAQLAFEAPTVFEGKIISMTPDRRANFSATVEVKEIFKQQIGFRLQKYLRLQFAYRNTSGECDIYREQLRSRGLVRGDELEQGRIYLLFVQQIDLGNFTILGQPIRKTRRVIEAIKNAVSENYAQLAAIRSITASNRTVENGKELRIVCKVQGRPPPKVTWFKDHKSINRNRRLYQIVPFKKRSELIIRSFNSSDAGRYECRAKNKVNRNLERRAIVIKAYPVPRYETHLTGGTGHSCPPDAAEFCFNGGTCKLFVEIGSYSCICPEGFIGERCDRKEVNNMPPNPTYKTGYIADDPNAYDAELTGEADLDGSRSARLNRTAFSDDTDDTDEIDENEDESLEDD